MIAPALRMQRVATVLLRHGFGEILQLQRPSTARLATRLARVLADLGPTFIKLGQLLATRQDLFPVEVTRALATLTASVPPMKARVAVRQLERGLGAELDRAFASFDPAPLAAASIGQVHRARLRDGRRVVVKVQRPGLASMVAADLQLMRLLARLLAQAVPELAALDLVGLLDAFERSITAELDYRREADNAARLERLLAGAPEVRVPRIERALTRPTVLVMEEVRGRRLDALGDAEKRAARAALLRAFSRQILDHGFFHADPHPGNVLVEASGRLVLLDLGAVETIDRALLAGIGRLVRALALRRTSWLGDAVLALACGGAAGVDRARLDADLTQIVDGASGRADGAEVLGRMIALGQRHRLRLPPALLALVRALALLDGVLRSLDPARDLVADLRKEWLLSALRRLWNRTLGSVTTWARKWHPPDSPVPLLMQPLLPLMTSRAATSSRPPST